MHYSCASSSRRKANLKQEIERDKLTGSRRKVSPTQSPSSYHKPPARTPLGAAFEPLKNRCGAFSSFGQYLNLRKKKKRRLLGAFFQNEFDWIASRALRAAKLCNGKQTSASR
jgi:hypothetical protein